MVNFLNATKNIFITILLSVAFVACNNDELQDLASVNSDKECTLILNIQGEVRSGENLSFKDGDKIYFYFIGNSKFSGIATYDNTGKWVLNHEGDISTGENGVCNVVFAEGGDLQPTEYNYYEVDSNIALFGTKIGQWEYVDGIMSVSAYLKPLQVALQFVSDQAMDIMVKGIQPQDNFDIRTLSFFTYNSKYRPCYPQTIKVNNKLEDGKYYSQKYYVLGLGPKYYNNNSSKIGCWHCIYPSGLISDDPIIYNECTIEDNIYIYNQSDIEFCYKRHHADTLDAGDLLIINIPTRDSHIGWERVNNKIKDIASSIVLSFDSEHSYNTGILNSGGFSVNFGVKKTNSSSIGLYIHDGQWTAKFHMSTPNNNWENYSITSDNYNEIDCPISFSFYGGTTPGMEFKDVSYSHFPYFTEYHE